jgi:prolyl-tRNA synthetase
MVQKPYSFRNITNPYEAFKFFKQISHDVRSDINFPNKLRPSENPGYGDDKGLRFPWEIAPLQVVIVPISDDAILINKARNLREEVGRIANADIDLSDKSAGEKFNYWEMKGVPIRIDLGPKDLQQHKLTVFRRDIGKKEVIEEKELVDYVKKVAKESTINLVKQADKLFDGRIVDVKSIGEMKKAIESGNIVKCNFCSVDMDGEKCAGVIEKDVGASVRGTRLDEKDKVSGKCVVCGKKANALVYVARQY